MEVRQNSVDFDEGIDRIGDGSSNKDRTIQIYQEKFNIFRIPLTKAIWSNKKQTQDEVEFHCSRRSILGALERSL